MLDHIDLRVSNLARCRPLYDALLPAIGLTQLNADEESVGYHPPHEDPSRPFVWLVEDTSHTPGLTRVAFAGKSREDVDRLSEIARQAGATAFEPAGVIAEYGPNYYASFFEDADGNRLEICCRKIT